MRAGDSHHEEREGEVLPSYTGVNAPKIEAEPEKSADPVFYEGHVPEDQHISTKDLTPLQEKAFRNAARAAKELVEVLPASLSEPNPTAETGRQTPEREEDPFVRAVREEREDDRAGTYPGSSSNEQRPRHPKEKINPRTGRPTVRDQNANEKTSRNRHWRSYGKYYRQPGQSS